MSVGKIQIDIISDISKLVTGLDKANAKLESWERKVSKTVTRITRKFKVGLSVAGITFFQKKYMDMARDISNQASKIDVSTDAIQKYGMAFESAGYNVEVFTDGVNQMKKIVGTMSEGSQSYDIIKQLGLDPESLKNLKTEDAFRKVTSEIQKLGNSTERTAAFGTLFGESTGKALSTIATKYGDINRLADEYQQYVIPEKQISSLNKINKSLDNLSNMWNSVSAAFASSGFGLMIKEIIDYLHDLGLKFKDTLSTQFRDAYSDYSTIIVSIMTVTGQMKDAFINGLNVIKAAWNGLLISINAIAKKILQVVKTIIDAMTFDITGSRIGDWARVLGVDTSGIESVSNGFKKMSSTVDGYINTLSSNIQGLMGPEIEVIDVFNTEERLKANFEKLKTYLNVTDESVKRVNTSTKDLNDNLDKTATKAQKAGKKIKEMGQGESWDVNINKLNDFNSTLENMGGTLFDNLINKSKSWGDIFGNILKDIAKKMFEIYVWQKMLGSFGLGGGVSGFSISSPSVTAYAKGGVVNSPTLFNSSKGLGVMGEAGSEAILPLTRVNGKLGVSAENTNPVVNVNVINNTTSDVKVNQQGNEIQIVIDRIASDIHNGTGPIGTSMEQRYGLRKV